GGRAALAATDVGDQKRQRRRRHTVDPAGLANGAGPQRRELLPNLVGEAGKHCVVELLRQLETFITAIGLDVRQLPVEIDGILGADLELLGDLRIQRGELRPYPSHFGETERRIRQQVERGATLTVAVERNAMLLRFVRSDGE